VDEQVSKDNPRLWERLHTQERFRPRYPSERVVQFLSRLSGTLLDFGCGAGRHMKLAKELGFDVYGSDISAVAREYAKQWGQIGELSAFPDDFFDVVICYGVLYYLSSSELDPVIAQLRRVLRGQMLLVVRSRKDYRIRHCKPLGSGDYVVAGGGGPVQSESGMLMHFMSPREVKSRFRHFAAIQIDELMNTTEGGRYRDHDYVVQVSKYSRQDYNRGDRSLLT
jgi:SAM-dependent methyltransferase